MQDSRAARRYAQALYEVAVERKLVDKVEEDLGKFQSILEAYPGVYAYYNSPSESREAKVKLVTDLFTPSFSPLSLELIKLMVTKGRAREVDAVRAEFVKIRLEETGIVSAQVTSAIPLTKTETTKLTKKLESLTGHRVESEYAVDPNILGGIRVVYNNVSIDGTLKGALDNLRQKLRYDVLKQA